MDFEKNLPALIRAFHDAKIRFALIGGLAMAIRGLQRATIDADFILLLDDQEKAHQILQELGYVRKFKSDNVSHYLSHEDASARIDLLHAFRPITLGMLERSEKLPFNDQLDIPTVQIEDIIGLKIQALSNDPTRALSDWSDIHLLVQHTARTEQPLDWPRIQDYLSLFGLDSKLADLKQIYG